MLVFGGYETLCRIQERAKGLFVVYQCFTCISVCKRWHRLELTGSSQSGSSDGDLAFQRCCSTGQKYILMTELMDKCEKGVVTCLCFKF